LGKYEETCLSSIISIECNFTQKSLHYHLTLTGYNSEYSDHPFSKKRDMAGGFRESPLRLNEGLRILEDWGVPQIMDRANQLAKKASMVWKAPVL